MKRSSDAIIDLTEEPDNENETEPIKKKTKTTEKQEKSTGVNKKPKKFKTVWHGFRGILKLSGRVNQASLKLSAGFSNTVCWTS